MDRHEDLSILQALFDKYDIKQKKALDLTDLETLFLDVLIDLGEENPEKYKNEVAKESLNLFDKNQNGTIEFDEFMDIIDFLVLEKGYEIDNI